MEHTAVIRTLGTAGEKYRQLLQSLQQQTVPPSAIIVYLTEGYPTPKETIGTERYARVPKGMVAQRALPYREVQTEYCLFLDDDVFLPPRSVESLYKSLQKHGAYLIAPAVFYHTPNLILAALGTQLTYRDPAYSYKVLATGGFPFNNHRTKEVLHAQTNTGPCFFRKKQTMANLHFEDELWLDKAGCACSKTKPFSKKPARWGIGN